MSDVADASVVGNAAISSAKIPCALCGAEVHVISKHLETTHPEVSLEQYQERFPAAPLLSDIAKQHIEKAQAKARADSAVSVMGDFSVKKRAMHEVFQLPPVKSSMSSIGNQPIPISIFESPAAIADLVPEVDEHYVFNTELLKTVLLGLEINENVYLWGHAGVGKTTVIEQVCAYTKRPWFRVQHTRNMEEAHVVGQWTVKSGETVFELGPLPYAMKHGLVYVADEYDCGAPGVIALYQAVLEGKALVIKDADRANRIIKPHPMFRFVATGNTNGTGDETGLYAGTLQGNAANYERFGIVEEVLYPEEKVEIAVVMAKGKVKQDIAKQLVDFARRIREAFSGGTIGLPISTRALVKAANLGRRTASMNKGLQLAYVNRLTRIDQEAARGYIDRAGIQ